MDYTVEFVPPICRASWKQVRPIFVDDLQYTSWNASDQ